jgi:hypothetical protein
MPGNRYEFLTHWRAEATPAEVYGVLEETADLPRWWPAVWLKVETLSRAAPGGVGSRYRLTSKGWLPYVLVWEMTTVEKVFPERIALRADGDFRGSGVWTFRPDGAFTDAEYRWEIEAEKPLLKYLSFVFKPLFRANHNWAMRVGEASLKLELARRRAATDADREKVPPPPGPTFLGPRKRRKLGLA